MPEKRICNLPMLRVEESLWDALNHSAAAVKTYPAGYFYAPVLRWPGLRHYVPSSASSGYERAQKLAELARLNRTLGVGFCAGGGTIALPGTPVAQKEPGWM